MEHLDETAVADDHAAIDLNAEDGAMLSVEAIGYASVAAAVLAVVIGASSEIGDLVVSGIKAAISSVTGGLF